MNKNENSIKKKFRYLFSGIPLKLKSLNLHKSSLKKKPSRNIFYDEKKSRRIATARDKSLFNFNLYGNGLGALVIVGCALCCYLYFDFEYSVLLVRALLDGDNALLGDCQIL